MKTIKSLAKNIALIALMIGFTSVYLHAGKDFVSTITGSNQWQDCGEYGDPCGEYYNWSNICEPGSGSCDDTIQTVWISEGVCDGLEQCWTI